MAQANIPNRNKFRIAAIMATVLGASCAEECLRHSDCAEGWYCARARCVPEMGAADASAGGAAAQSVNTPSTTRGGSSATPERENLDAGSAGAGGAPP
jgi:hypothetical protein